MLDGLIVIQHQQNPATMPDDRLEESHGKALPSGGLRRGGADRANGGQTANAGFPQRLDEPAGKEGRGFFRRLEADPGNSVVSMPGAPRPLRQDLRFAVARWSLQQNQPTGCRFQARLQRQPLDARLHDCPRREAVRRGRAAAARGVGSALSRESGCGHGPS